MLLQPITVPFSKSTLKPSVYTLNYDHVSPTQGIHKIFRSIFKSQKRIILEWLKVTR